MKERNSEREFLWKSDKDLDFPKKMFELNSEVRINQVKEARREYAPGRGNGLCKGLLVETHGEFVK